VPVDFSLREILRVTLMQQNRHLDIQCLDSSYKYSFLNHAEEMCDQARRAYLCDRKLNYEHISNHLASSKVSSYV
jgi:hypothetical protein